MNEKKKILIILALLACFLSSFCHNYIQNMNDFLKANGDYIEYFICPANKKVQLSLIKTKHQFDSILVSNNSKRLDVNMNEGILHDSNFLESFPFYDYRNLTKAYQLSNGFIAIDQSGFNKSNPFYLCRSIEVHKYVCKYLSIYYIEKFRRPIIECRVYGHNNIKSFLQSIKLKFIRSDVDKGFKLFLTDDNQYVYVRFKDEVNSEFNLKTNKLAKVKESFNASEVYYDLIIFESVEIMNLLGVLDLEYNEIDESNYSDHNKLIFSFFQDPIPVKIINSKNLSSYVEVHDLNKLEANNNLFEPSGILINNNRILYKYSDFIYMLFEPNESLSSCIENLNSNKKGNRFGKLDSLHKLLLNCSTLNEQVSPDFFYKIKDLKKRPKLVESLTLFEEEINKFFFDDFFIEKFLVDIVKFIGHLILDNYEGEWHYSLTLERCVLNLNGNITLDFIPELMEEMERQKYTGHCPIWDIIEKEFEIFNLNIRKHK